MVSNAERLRQAYPTDLEVSLSDELLQFSAFLKMDFANRSLDVATSPVASAASTVPSVAETSLDDAEPVVTKDDDDDVTSNVESLELRMYRLIVANNMEIVFPNTWIALRIYLSFMISNCSGERSISKLRRIKNELRSCMTQTRLNSLTLLSVESEILRNIDVSSLINDFAPFFYTSSISDFEVP